MIDARRELAVRARANRTADHTTIVAVAGPVAVGKSTLASALADTIVADGASVTVVSTDGFLYPYAELAARNLLMHKGFPDSYDVDALQAFLGAVRTGVPEVAVPVYSHETYDIAPEPRIVARSEFIVLEGLNALYATVGLVDVAVYVHADESVIQRWYIERFQRLCAAAEPGSFYEQFAGLDEPQIDEIARHTWTSINLVNLREFIAPSRDYATVIVEKQPDHSIGAIIDVAER